MNDSNNNIVNLRILFIIQIINKLNLTLFIKKQHVQEQEGSTN